MQKACKEGRKDIIDLMILNNDYNYNIGLAGACEGGHIELVELMLSLGAKNYNDGLYYACEGGHLEIIKMMIDLGATRYNLGLYIACEHNHIDIIMMFIDVGANDYNYLKYGNIECKIMCSRLTRKVIDLPIKTEHPEYHLLRVYGKKIPDIDRIINKYLF